MCRDEALELGSGPGSSQQVDGRRRVRLGLVIFPLNPCGIAKGSTAQLEGLWVAASRAPHGSVMLVRPTGISGLWPGSPGTGMEPEGPFTVTRPTAMCETPGHCGSKNSA